MESLEKRKYERAMAFGGRTGLIRKEEAERKKLKQLVEDIQKYRVDIKRLNVLWKELQGFGFDEGYVVQLLDENNKNLISGTIGGFNERSGMIGLKMGKSTNLLTGESNPIRQIGVSRFARLLSKEATSPSSSPSQKI